MITVGKAHPARPYLTNCFSSASPRLCGEIFISIRRYAELDKALPFQAISKNTVTASSQPDCCIRAIIDQLRRKYEEVNSCVLAITSDMINNSGLIVISSATSTATRSLAT
jgi:hypothetical protein